MSFYICAYLQQFCSLCNRYFKSNAIPAWGAPDDEEGDCNIEIDAGDETEGDDKRFPFVVLVACCAMRRFCCCATDDLVVGILSCILLLPCQAFCTVGLFPTVPEPDKIPEAIFELVFVLPVGLLCTPP